MKKSLLIIIILLLGGAGYLAFQRWAKHANITRWSFIPSEAIMVADVRLMNDFDNLSGYQVWKTLRRTSGFKRIDEGIAFLDSINGKGGFSATFEETPVLISAHQISNDDLDFLFVVDIENTSQNTFAEVAIGHLKKSGFRFKTRNYNGHKLSEISKNRKAFTFIFFKNMFLASFTPYLIEDAIRTVEDEQSSFEDVFLKDNSVPSGESFTTYFNYPKTSRLLSSVLLSEANLPMLSGSYSLSLDSSYLSFSGFSYAENSWMNTHHQQPSNFDMIEIIPKNTAFVHHIASANIADWQKRQLAYLATSEPEIKAFQDSLRTAYDFDVNQLLDLVDEEIGIVTLEAISPRDNRKMCILEVKDTGKTLKFLNQLTSRIATVRGNSIYSESYSENEIRYLPIRDFPKAILGKMAYGFNECFYVNHRNYVILSNHLEELKSLFKTIQNEDTWGKSLRMNSFLQRANDVANYSLYVNIPRSKNLILKELSPHWSATIQENLASYQAFELAAFQFSYSENKHFSNFTFSQPEPLRTTMPKVSPSSETRFVSKLITKPFLLRTHAYRSRDILLQDSTYAIHYLNQNQNILWVRNVGAKIVGDVFPIDFYKNGKIQYAFATKDEIHIWDRTGVAIPGYPRKLENASKIEHFNVIDYNMSRDYRLAISDDQGHVYLSNKELKVLNGWSPKDLERSSLIPLRHKRIGRRDVMLSIQTDGKIHLMNRRGDAMSGFPFDTKQTLVDNYFLNASNSLDKSTITVLSAGGELMEINLEGDVVRHDQLIKTQQEARFQLIPDRAKKSYLVVRKEGNSYQVLDDTGNFLFQKDYPSTQEMLIQYYQFGAGKDVITFIDRSNETLYIFDKDGRLLTSNPLSASHEVGILYYNTRKKFQVFSTSATNLETYTF